MTAVLAQPEMTYEYARARTDMVKRALDKMGDILQDLHDREAWEVLGYSSWADYIKTAFSISKSRAYHLTDHRNFLREIKERERSECSIGTSQAPSSRCTTHSAS